MRRSFNEVDPNFKSLLKSLDFHPSSLFAACCEHALE